MAKKKILEDVKPMEERKPSFRLRDKDYPFVKDLKANQKVGLKVSTIVKGFDEVEFEEGKPWQYEFQIQSVEALKGDEKVKRSEEEEEKIKKAVTKIKSKPKATGAIKAMREALAKLEGEKNKG